jgi:Ca2+-transporting ATPase
MVPGIDAREVRGLSEGEAAARFRMEGPNELPSAKPHSLVAITLELLREPMLLLLVGAGCVYLLLGELRESLVLLASIFVVLGISLYQRQKTEHALEALRDLSSPRALVIRDGKERRIAGREVVRGDFVVLFEGDRVPADGVVHSCVSLSVDESLLTGESVPVRKSAGADAKSGGRPGGDDFPFVFSGTMVVQGHGIAEITATGTHTELGTIGKALKTLEPEKTPLKREVARLVRILATSGLSVCGMVALVYGLRGKWLDGLLVGITMAMSLLPEEFPVVLTIFMALGAWRIAQKHVLTRQSSAIETLGSATVLCVDKTGTLTQNRMSVQRLFANGHYYPIIDHNQDPLPEQFHELLEFSILASQRKPFDPMDIAFQQLGERYLSDSEHLHAEWVLAREYPLSPRLLAVSRAWSVSGPAGLVVAAKGAPAAIIELCRLSPAEAERIKRDAETMAREGLRILGVAKARFHGESLPGDPHAFRFEFLGLVGLADPVRHEVAAAIEECYAAGIRVVMITGDFAGTAQSIAGQVGLRSPEKVITGPELDHLNDEELRRLVAATNIFARVVPEQKLRLIEGLKANGEVVAMTGDGVNDAPALKSAHIGIAMGGRGTDVAREAADLVLLDDAFSSIVEAIRLGRRIYDNLKKAMSYVLAVHVPIAGLALIPVLLKWPLVLLPVHVVFLELIIDPACSVAFEAEPEEAGLMKRPPRDPKEKFFNGKTLLLSFLQGASVLFIVMGVFVIARLRGEPETNVRALTFTTLIVGNLALILANRSWSRIIVATLRSPNPALWWIVTGALCVLGLVLYVPFIRELFRFSMLHGNDLLICLGAGLVSVLWFEALKMVARGRLVRA